MYKYTIIHIIISYTTFTTLYNYIYIYMYPVAKWWIVQSFCSSKASIFIFLPQRQDCDPAGGDPIGEDQPPAPRHPMVPSLDHLAALHVVLARHLHERPEPRITGHGALRKTGGAWDIICHVHYKGYCFNCCLYHYSHYICLDTYIYI